MTAEQERAAVVAKGVIAAAACLALTGCNRPQVCLDGVLYQDADRDGIYVHYDYFPDCVERGEHPRGGE